MVTWECKFKCDSCGYEREFDGGEIDPLSSVQVQLPSGWDAVIGSREGVILVRTRCPLCADNKTQGIKQ